MSYVNKKERIFKYGEPLDIPHTRSESRMKKYWSATDRRAWCDTVELRRQHILELNAKNKGQFCLENFIPLDVLFNIMAANKDDEIAKLQERIDYLEALINVYRQIQLTPDQQKQLDDMNAELAKERKKLAAARKEREELEGSKDPGRKKKGKRKRKPKDDQRRSSSEESARPRTERKKRTGSEPGEGDARKKPTKGDKLRDGKTPRTPREGDKDAGKTKGEEGSPRAAKRETRRGAPDDVGSPDGTRGRGRRKSKEEAPLGKEKPGEKRAPSEGERRGPTPGGAKGRGDKGDTGEGKGLGAALGEPIGRGRGRAAASIERPGKADKPREADGKRKDDRAPSPRDKVGKEGDEVDKKDKDKDRGLAGRPGDRAGAGRVRPRGPDELEEAERDGKKRARSPAPGKGKDAGEKPGDVGDKGKDKDKGLAGRPGDKAGTGKGRPGEEAERDAKKRPVSPAPGKGKDTREKPGGDVGDKGKDKDRGLAGKPGDKAGAGKGRPGEADESEEGDREGKRKPADIGDKGKAKDKASAGRPGDRAAAGKGRPGEPDESDEATKKKPAASAADVGDKGKEKDKGLAGKPGDKAGAGKGRPGEPDELEKAERDAKRGPAAGKGKETREKPGDTGDKGKDSGLAGAPGDRAGAGRGRPGEPGEFDEAAADGNKRPLSPAPTKGKDAREKPGAVGEKDKDKDVADRPGAKSGAGRGRPGESDESEGALLDGKKKPVTPGGAVGDKGKDRELVSEASKPTGRTKEAVREEGKDISKTVPGLAVEEMAMKKFAHQADQARPKGKLSPTGEEPEGRDKDRGFPLDDAKGRGRERPDASGELKAPSTPDKKKDISPAKDRKAGEAQEGKRPESPIDGARGRGRPGSPDSAADRRGKGRPGSPDGEKGPDSPTASKGKDKDVIDGSKRRPSKAGKGPSAQGKDDDETSVKSLKLKTESQCSANASLRRIQEAEKKAKEKGKGDRGRPGVAAKPGDKEKADRRPSSPDKKRLRKDGETLDGGTDSIGKDKDKAKADQLRPGDAEKGMPKRGIKTGEEDRGGKMAPGAPDKGDIGPKGRDRPGEVGPPGGKRPSDAEKRKGVPQDKPEAGIAGRDKDLKEDGLGKKDVGREKPGITDKDEAARAGKGDRPAGVEGKDVKPGPGLEDKKKVGAEDKDKDLVPKAKDRAGPASAVGKPGEVDAKRPGEEGAEDKLLADKDRKPKTGVADKDMKDKREREKDKMAGEKPSEPEKPKPSTKGEDRQPTGDETDKIKRPEKESRVTITDDKGKEAPTAGKRKEDKTVPGAKEMRDKKKIGEGEKGEADKLGKEPGKDDKSVTPGKQQEDPSKKGPPKLFGPQQADVTADKVDDKRDKPGKEKLEGIPGTGLDKVGDREKDRQPDRKGGKPVIDDKKETVAKPDAGKRGKPEEGKVDRVGEKRPPEDKTGLDRGGKPERDVTKPLGEKEEAGKPRTKLGPDEGEKPGEKPTRKPGEAKEDSKLMGKGTPKTAPATDEARGVFKEGADQKLAEEERTGVPGRPVKEGVPSRVTGEALDDKYKGLPAKGDIKKEPGKVLDAEKGKGVPGKPVRGRTPSQVKGEAEPSADDKGIPGKLPKGIPPSQVKGEAEPSADDKGVPGKLPKGIPPSQVKGEAEPSADDKGVPGKLPRGIPPSQVKGEAEPSADDKGVPGKLPRGIPSSKVKGEPEPSAYDKGVPGKLPRGIPPSQVKGEAEPSADDKGVPGKLPRGMPPSLVKGEAEPSADDKGVPGKVARGRTPSQLKGEAEMAADDKYKGTPGKPVRGGTPTQVKGEAEPAADDKYKDVPGKPVRGRTLSQLLGEAELAAADKDKGVPAKGEIKKEPTKMLDKKKGLPEEAVPSEELRKKEPIPGKEAGIAGAPEKGDIKRKPSKVLDSDKAKGIPESDDGKRKPSKLLGKLGPEAEKSKGIEKKGIKPDDGTLAFPPEALKAKEELEKKTRDKGVPEVADRVDGKKGVPLKKIADKPTQVPEMGEPSAGMLGECGSVCSEIAEELKRKSKDKQDTTGKGIPGAIKDDKGKQGLPDKEGAVGGPPKKAVGMPSKIPEEGDLTAEVPGAKEPAKDKYGKPIAKPLPVDAYGKPTISGKPGAEQGVEDARKTDEDDDLQKMKGYRKAVPEKGEPSGIEGARTGPGRVPEDGKRRPSEREGVTAAVAPGGIPKDTYRKSIPTAKPEVIKGLEDDKTAEVDEEDRKRPKGVEIVGKPGEVARPTPAVDTKPTKGPVGERRRSSDRGTEPITKIPEDKKRRSSDRGTEPITKVPEDKKRRVPDRGVEPITRVPEEEKRRVSDRGAEPITRVPEDEKRRVSDRGTEPITKIPEDEKRRVPDRGAEPITKIPEDKKRRLSDLGAEPITKVPEDEKRRVSDRGAEPITKVPEDKKRRLSDRGAEPITKVPEDEKRRLSDRGTEPITKVPEDKKHRLSDRGAEPITKVPEDEKRRVSDRGVEPITKVPEDKKRRLSDLGAEPITKVPEDEKRRVPDRGVEPITKVPEDKKRRLSDLGAEPLTKVPEDEKRRVSGRVAEPITVGEIPEKKAKGKEPAKDEYGKPIGKPLPTDIYGKPIAAAKPEDERGLEEDRRPVLGEEAAKDKDYRGKIPKKDEVVGRPSEVAGRRVSKPDEVPEGEKPLDRGKLPVAVTGLPEELPTGLPEEYIKDKYGRPISKPLEEDKKAVPDEYLKRGKPPSLVPPMKEEEVPSIKEGRMGPSDRELPVEDRKSVTDELLDKGKRLPGRPSIKDEGLGRPVPEEYPGKAKPVPGEPALKDAGLKEPYEPKLVDDDGKPISDKYPKAAPGREPSIKSEDLEKPAKPGVVGEFPKEPSRKSEDLAGPSEVPKGKMPFPLDRMGIPTTVGETREPVPTAPPIEYMRDEYGRPIAISEPEKRKLMEEGKIPISEEYPEEYEGLPGVPFKKDEALIQPSEPSEYRKFPPAGITVPSVCSSVCSKKPITRPEEDIGGERELPMERERYEDREAVSEYGTPRLSPIDETPITITEPERREPARKGEVPLSDEYPKTYGEIPVVPPEKVEVSGEPSKIPEYLKFQPSEQEGLPVPAGPQRIDVPGVCSSVCAKKSEGPPKEYLGDELKEPISEYGTPQQSDEDEIPISMTEPGVSPPLKKDRVPGEPSRTTELPALRPSEQEGQPSEREHIEPISEYGTPRLADLERPITKPREPVEEGEGPSAEEYPEKYEGIPGATRQPSEQEDIPISAELRRPAAGVPSVCGAVCADTGRKKVDEGDILDEKRDIESREPPKEYLKDKLKEPVSEYGTPQHSDEDEIPVQDTEPGVSPPLKKDGLPVADEYLKKYEDIPQVPSKGDEILEEPSRTTEPQAALRPSEQEEMRAEIPRFGVPSTCSAVCAKRKGREVEDDRKSIEERRGGEEEQLADGVEYPLYVHETSSEKDIGRPSSEEEVGPSGTRRPSKPSEAELEDATLEPARSVTSKEPSTDLEDTGAMFLPLEPEISVAAEEPSGKEVAPSTAEEPPSVEPDVVAAPDTQRKKPRKRSKKFEKGKEKIKALLRRRKKDLKGEDVSAPEGAGSTESFSEGSEEFESAEEEVTESSEEQGSEESEEEIQKPEYAPKGIRDAPCKAVCSRRQMERPLPDTTLSGDSIEDEKTMKRTSITLEKDASEQPETEEGPSEGEISKQEEGSRSLASLEERSGEMISSSADLETKEEVGDEDEENEAEIRQDLEVPSGTTPLIESAEGEQVTLPAEQLDIFSIGTQDETFVSARSRDEAVETIRTDHKCMAVCRNARDRPPVFREETGGVIMGTDLDTPHDLVPPGYYLPEDVSPRPSIPEWADVPEAAPIQTEELSLSDIDTGEISDTDKAVWIVPEPEEELLEAPKGDDMVESSESQEKLEIPENLRTGNIMSRVLSGQLVGIPPTSILIDGSSPQTLPEAIYQQKMSKVCRAPCGQEKTERDEIDDEVEETIGDVSDIHTDSEMPDDVYRAGIASDVGKGLQITEEVLEEKDSAERDEPFEEDYVDTVEEREAIENVIASDSYTDAKDESYSDAVEPIETTETTTDQLESHEIVRIVSEPVDIPGILVQGEKVKRNLSVNVDDPKIESYQIPLSDYKYEESVAEDENPILENDEDKVDEEPTIDAVTATGAYITESSPRKLEMTDSESDSVLTTDLKPSPIIASTTEDEYTEAHSTASADKVQQTEEIARPSTAEQASAVTEDEVVAKQYTEAIQKMPAVKRDTLPRFASWFAPKEETPEPLDAMEKHESQDSSTQFEKADIRSVETSISDRFESVCHPTCRKTPVTITSTPCPYKCGSLRPKTQDGDASKSEVLADGDVKEKPSKSEETLPAPQEKSVCRASCRKAPQKSTSTIVRSGSIDQLAKTSSIQTRDVKSADTSTTDVRKSVCAPTCRKSTEASASSKPCPYKCGERFRSPEKPPSVILKDSVEEPIEPTAETEINNELLDSVVPEQIIVEHEVVPVEEPIRPRTHVCSAKLECQRKAAKSEPMEPEDKSVCKPTCRKASASTTTKPCPYKCGATNRVESTTAETGTDNELLDNVVPEQTIVEQEVVPVKEPISPRTHVCRAKLECQRKAAKTRPMEPTNLEEKSVCKPTCRKTSASTTAKPCPYKCETSSQTEYDTAETQTNTELVDIVAPERIKVEHKVVQSDDTVEEPISTRAYVCPVKLKCQGKVAITEANIELLDNVVPEQVIMEYEVVPSDETAEEPIGSRTYVCPVKLECQGKVAKTQRMEPTEANNELLGSVVPEQIIVEYEVVLPDDTVEEPTSPRTYVCPVKLECQRKAAKATSTTELSSMELEDNLRRLAEPPQIPCRAACATFPLSKENEIKLLTEEIEAKDAYCAEQRKIATAALEQLENIKNIVEERDDLRKKLENSQFELAELKKNLELGFGDVEVAEKKSDVYVPFKDNDSSSTKSSDEEIKVMEDEIKQMRTAPLSPEQETKVIKKEVEVLKRYCSKLSLIQEENSRLKKSNEQLRMKCLESEEKLQMLGYDGDQNTFASIRNRLSTLNDTIAERDVLQNRVRNLERELNAYQDLPADVEVFKKRSELLDDVLKDRDRLAKRVEQMRGVDEELMSLKQKAERVDELERQLRLATRDVQSAEDELDSMRNKCAMAEIEMLNQKTEADTLRSRLVCMEHEMESLKSMCKEQELLQIEKDRLQVSLDELVRMQDDYEHMCVQMKSLDVVKAERDLYKRKYDELVGLESECNMLRDQLDKAKIIEREKESLERQAEDLEKCICEQEDEIRRLVTHIDCLAKGKEEQQNKMKEMVSGLKIELEKKESLLIESEEKMATMHGKIDTSFHSLSEETEMLRTEKKLLEEEKVNLMKENIRLGQENEKLQDKLTDVTNENSILKERLQNKTEENKHLQMQLDDKEEIITTMQNNLYYKESTSCQNLQAKLRTVINENNSLKEQLTDLQVQLDDKDRVIETMQEVLDDRESSAVNEFAMSCNAQEITRLQIELEQAKLENQQLQILAAQSSDNSPETNYQLKSTLEQSKHAIERISLELGQQFQEWDSKKRYRCCPGCRCKQKGRQPEPKVIIKCCAGCTCKKKSKAPDSGSYELKSKCTCNRKKSEINNCPCKDASQQYPESPTMCGCCKCRSAREAGTDPKPSECKSKCVGSPGIEEPPKVSKSTGDSWKKLALPSDSEDDADEDQMYTARSADGSKVRIAELENELLKANETILQLKEQLAVSDRLTAENSALRKHSTEVQEVAKDQIEELVKHLKKSKERIEELETVNQQLVRDLDKASQQLIDSDREDLLHDLKRAMDKINELQSKNCKQKFELASIKQQLGRMGAREDEKAMAAKLQSELEECLKEREKLLNFIENLKQQLTTSKEGADLPDLAAYAQLKTDLAECLKEKENLLSEIDKLKKSLKEYTEKSDDELLAKIQADLEACLKEKESLLKIINNLQSQLEPGIKGELPDMKAFAKLQADLDNCTKEKDLLRKALENLSAEKEHLLKTINELQNQLATGKTDELPDMAAYAKISSELDSCLKDREVLTKALEDLKKQLASDNAAKENLQSQLENCLKEKQELLKKINELNQQAESAKSELAKALKEKDDLNNMLMSNVATTSRRSLSLENDLEALKNQNKAVLSEKDRLSKENKDLEAQIGALRSENNKLKEDLESLKAENELLKKQLENQNKLIEKLKHPSVTLLDKSEIDKKDKDAMQATIDNLEDQLRHLMAKEKLKPVEPTEDFKGKMNELLKQLEEAQKRADAAEDSLRKLKTSDPTAMLNAEMQKLKDRIAQLEKENSSLKDALSQSMNEKDTLKKNLDDALKDAKKLKDENNNLQKVADALKAEKDMQKVTDSSALKDENNNLKKKTEQLEDEIADLKKRLEQAHAETKKSSNLITENGDLKKRLAQLEGENSKLSKDLEAALLDAKKASDRLLDLEKDNIKCKQTVKDLEAEVAKLKKDLDNQLNDAKKSVDTVSNLQKEIAELKQKIAQLESIKAKMEDENNRVKKELEQARGGSQVIASLQDENNKMRQQNIGLQSEIDKLKKELENALLDAKSKIATATQLQDDVNNLKKKIQQLESENSDLKKKLAAATADDLQNNYDKLRQKLAEMENENTKLKKDLQKALDDAKKANDELNDLRQNEKKCKDKIAQLEVDNDKLKKNLNSALDDLKKLGTEVSGIQGDESKLKQKVALLEAENAKLKKDLDASSENARKAADEASFLKEENSKLKQRVAQLESENAKLKREMDSTLNDLKKLNDQMKKIQDENIKYQQKTKQMEDENEKLKQKLESATADAKLGLISDEKAKQLFEDELNRLKKELEAARKEAKDSSSLKEENNQLLQKLKQLENENAKLKKDLDAALAATKTAEAELSKLKSNEDKLKGQIALLEDSNNKLKKEKAALSEDVQKAATDLAKLSELKDNENKLKQRIAQLETENAKLKKDLDAALADAKRLSEELTNEKNDKNKLKQQMSKVESDNKKLKNDLDAATAEAKKGALGVSDLKEIDDRLKQRISQLEAENVKLKSELDKALDNAKKTLAELSKLQDDDSKLKQKIAQLELDNSKLMKDLNRAQSEAQSGLDGVTDSRSEAAKLKQKVSQLESEVDKLRKQLDAALNDASKKAAELLKFPDEITNLKKKIEQLEKENERLKKELDSAVTNQKSEADKGKKLQDENNKQKQEISRLENEINKLKKELDAAKSQLVTKTADEEDRKKLQQAENENIQLKKDLDKALREAGQVAALKDENTKMQQKLQKLQTDLDKMKADLETAKNEAKKSAADLAKIKESEAQLKQKVAKLESENVQLKKELDEAKSIAAEVNSLKAENKKLKDQIKQLQDEISRLKTAAPTVEAKPDESEKLKDELSKLKQKLAGVQAENAKIKEQYDQASEANKEMEKLKVTNKNLQSQLEDLKKQLAASKDQSQSLSSENEKLKKKIDLLEQELAKLKKELTAAADELAKTNENLKKIKDENAKLKDENTNFKAEKEKLQKDLKTSKDALNNALQKLEKIDGKDYEGQIKKLEAELEKQKKECQDTIASLKSQFDRDMKNLIAKNGDSIDKLQKAHADYIQDLNEKHGKEVKDLRNAIEKLRQELEAAIRERDRLRGLLDDQKRKSIDIKGKVEEVEKVISKERRRSKELEKKHSELQSKASTLEQEVVREREKSIELANKLRESLKETKDLKVQTEKLEGEKATLAKQKDEIEDKSDKLKRESIILQKVIEEERKKSKDLESDLKSMKEAETQKPKERKKKDDKLTMATFETVSVLPTVLAISPPLSDNELTFYGKKPCPCAKSMEELLKKAALKGFGALSIDELQFIHKQLSEAAANILERMGQKTGVLPPTEVGDRLSLLRRIAQLEGDLLKKQKQAQQKISQMQNAVKLEKDRLTELRKTLEREKSGGAPLEGPRKRISRDVEALEAMKSQLEKRLNQELLNKMKLTQKLSRPERRRYELPVRDGPPSTCTARDGSSPNRNPFARGHHSTGKL